MHLKRDFPTAFWAGSCRHGLPLGHGALFSVAGMATFEQTTFCRSTNIQGWRMWSYQLLQALLTFFRSSQLALVAGIAAFYLESANSIFAIARFAASRT